MNKNPFLLIAISSPLMLSSCSKPSAESQIIGTWSASGDLAGSTPKVEVHTITTFNSDHTLAVKIESPAYNETKIRNGQWTIENKKLIIPGEASLTIVSLKKNELIVSTGNEKGITPQTIVFSRVN